MSKPTAVRALRSVCTSWRTTQAVASFRPLSTSSPLKANMLSDTIDNVIANNFQRASDPDYRNIVPDAKYKNIAEGEWAADNRHHLHIYAHKHNTHITLSRPDRNPLISLSCGNIGFKKAGRGTYDAAYQLAAFVMARIQDKGFLMQSDESIKEIELVYRGFGQGREAVTKAILGSEGKNIRPLIKKLSDSTRLKFGGTRSKKPRRLG